MSRNSMRSHLSKCKGIQSGQAFQNLKHWMAAREVNIASEQDLNGSKWPESPGLSIAGVHASENGSGTWRHGRLTRDAILRVHQEFVVVSMTCIDSRLSDAIPYLFVFIFCLPSQFMVYNATNIAISIYPRKCHHIWAQISNRPFHPPGVCPWSSPSALIF